MALLSNLPMWSTDITSSCDSGTGRLAISMKSMHASAPWVGRCRLATRNVAKY